MESGDRTSLLRSKSCLEPHDYGSDQLRAMHPDSDDHTFQGLPVIKNDHLRISLTPSMTFNDMNEVNTAFAKKIIAACPPKH